FHKSFRSGSNSSRRPAKHYHPETRGINPSGSLSRAGRACPPGFSNTHLRGPISIKRVHLFRLDSRLFQELTNHGRQKAASGNKGDKPARLADASECSPSLPLRRLDRWCQRWPRSRSQKLDPGDNRQIAAVERFDLLGIDREHERHLSSVGI